MIHMEMREIGRALSDTQLVQVVDADGLVRSYEPEPDNNCRHGGQIYGAVGHGARMVAGCVAGASGRTSACTSACASACGSVCAAVATSAKCRSFL